MNPWIFFSRGNMKSDIDNSHIVEMYKRLAETFRYVIDDQQHFYSITATEWFEAVDKMRKEFDGHYVGTIR